MTSLTRPAFDEERKEGDPDLVAEITSLLVQANHPTPQRWLSSPLIQEAAFPCTPKLQLFLINRYWRVELGRVPNTQPERYCLMDGDVNYKEYLASFARHVVPRIVKEGL